MTSIDWFTTGRNNATDGKRRVGYGYWPPKGAGFVPGLYYRIGWMVGKILPNPR